MFARQGADGVSNLLRSLSGGSWLIAQSRSNFTTLPFTPQAAVAALQLLPKATHGTFIKLHVNAYIWGSCRNVLLLSLRVLFNPPPCSKMHRGTSAVQCDIPCPCSASATKLEGTGAGAGIYLGLSPWVPWSLLGFVPPSGIGMPCVLGQIIFRASLLLLYFAHFILT